MVLMNTEHWERHLRRPLQMLRVEELKGVLRDFSLQFGGKRQTNGVKAALTARITSMVEAWINGNETSKVVTALKSMNQHSPQAQWVYHNETLYNLRMLSQEERTRIPQGVIDSFHARPLSSVRIRFAAPQPRYNNVSSQQTSSTSDARPVYAPNVHFICNAFYQSLMRVTTPVICHESYTGARKRIISFNLTQQYKEMLAQPHHELRLTCGVLKKNRNVIQLIALEYPPVCELSVNGTRVNIPGIRGSIRKLPTAVNPPDITKLCNINGSNTVDFTYGCAVQKYVVAVEIVEHRPVETLVQEMRERRLLSKESVIQQYRQKRQDADIVLEAEMLSLKCPLGFTRITAPCRSRSCRHMQCFEAATFLSMNEQTPTWTCPVCNQKINSIQDLVIDGYFDDILSTVGGDVHSVRINPDGQLQLLKENSTDSNTFETAGSDTNENAIIILDDDDEEGVQLTREPGIGDKRPREDDVTSAVIRQETNAHSQVIDLTLSDDEEETNIIQGQQQHSLLTITPSSAPPPPSSSTTTSGFVAVLPAPSTTI
ncbi:hypothetical protein K492DRAFT_203423 [Lichtheimia hyalospora FSU 10163]|nr:hypothetical protein K492DRAFT_203423 [Lichtheimia hyalospora FSU 10163]